ncbi:hypothetical protein DQJ87_20655 [Salmonella enterica subsp. enterica]|nr:hypothetical protein [Salmonella enterica subsp. enterica serovar London]EBA1945608.1 hypothetical protein [Salmonella enterica]EBV1736661.1 hypothetical protein [Salmonella enterica subsp. enterica serovar Bredeney]ECB6474697.1 hypothetical protein [Salmonella enterica subsp. enterica serovar Alachua]EBR9430443.1 hypothetical protein [Salmonella enterica subsp. enterica serovar London]
MVEKITEKNIADISSYHLDEKINDKIKKKIKKQMVVCGGGYSMQLNIVGELKKINAKQKNDFHDVSANNSLNASTTDFRQSLRMLQLLHRKGRIEKKGIINSNIIAQSLQKKNYFGVLSTEVTIDDIGNGSNPGKLSATNFLAQQKGAEQPSSSTYSEKATVIPGGNDFLARQKGAEQPSSSTYSEKATVIPGGNDFLARQKGAEQPSSSTYSEKATVISGGNDFLAQQKGRELFSLSHHEKDVNRTEVNPLVQQFKRNEFSKNVPETEFINSMKMKRVENNLRKLSVIKNFYRDGLLSKLTDRDIKNNVQSGSFAHKAASFEYQFNRWNGNHSVRVSVQTNDIIKFTPSDEQTSSLLSKNIANLAGYHTKTIEPYNRDEEQRGQQRQPWASEREDEA